MDTIQPPSYCVSPAAAAPLLVDVRKKEAFAASADLLPGALRRDPMPVYDALYAWCREAEAGQDEQHSWKTA